MAQGVPPKARGTRYCGQRSCRIEDLPGSPTGRYSHTARWVTRYGTDTLQGRPVGVRRLGDTGVVALLQGPPAEAVLPGPGGNG